MAAAESESIRKASERLNIVQPALSRQIAALEGELGVLLFARTKQRVRLTPAGEAYLADARWILREVQLAGERAARIASGKAGIIRLGFHETAGRSSIVADTFRDFRRAWPEIELRLLQMTSQMQIEAIARGELDAGFVYLPAKLPAGLSSRAVSVHRIWLALGEGHPLTGRRQISVVDLRDEDFVGISRSVNPVYYEAVTTACRKAGLEPRMVQETQSEATTMNLVGVGLGLALAISADEVSWTRGVVIRPVQGLSLSMSLALVWKTEGSGLTDRLVETLDTLLRSGA
ncbi:LysR family transcriptional regulator [Tianweitania sp. Rool2]|uniref:LysR family transcriptional regulator n=1 Tax=Oryzicola mucosus TaxID=2767425 RepID=A0A8J6PW78_9HYPH|nr:LysR family transcriptional regulator [Oryzicola mucosus]